MRVSCLTRFWPAVEQPQLVCAEAGPLGKLKDVVLAAFPVQTTCCVCVMGVIADAVVFSPSRVPVDRLT